MKFFVFLLTTFITAFVQVQAQSPVGRRKMASHMSVYDGQKMDTHAALLSTRSCAAQIVYEINADDTYRLNAAATNCDEKYKAAQQKLWAKSKWLLQRNKITIYALNVSLGHVYIVTFSGDKMIWTGTAGEGVITYERL